jgi:hypothetical protein
MMNVNDVEEYLSLDHIVNLGLLVWRTKCMILRDWALKSEDGVLATKVPSDVSARALIMDSNRYGEVQYARNILIMSLPSFLSL